RSPIHQMALDIRDKARGMDQDRTDRAKKIVESGNFTFHIEHNFARLVLPQTQDPQNTHAAFFRVEGGLHYCSCPDNKNSKNSKLCKHQRALAALVILHESGKKQVGAREDLQRFYEESSYAVA